MRRMPLYELACTVPWNITSEALDAMLAIASRDDMDEAEIARRMHGPKAPEALAFREGQRRDDTQRMTMRDGIACIAIDGPIFRYADMFTEMSGGVTTDALAKDFQRALDDPNVLAVLFVIDSPGGESTGINELSEAIYAARGTKPLGAYGEGLMASAAYWIASATDVIGIDASAWAGSVGTVLSVPDPAKQINRTIPFVSKQSPKKRPDPTTQTGRDYIQSLADRMTEVFIEAVMRNRGMTREAVLAVEGGMKIGSDAITAGLADQIASEEDMITLLRERAQQPHHNELTAPVRATGRKTLMANSNGFWAGFFGAAREEGLLDDAPAVPPAQIAAEANRPAPNAAHTDEIARLRQQLAESHAAQASNFVDGLIASNRALPAERDALTTAFLQASSDDLTHGPINLANGTQSSRTALLRASQEQRPAHSLTNELMPANQDAAQILTNTQNAPTANEGLSDEERTYVRNQATRRNGTTNRH